jgi:predicted Zn-dependent protease
MFKHIKNKTIAVLLAGIFALLIPAGSIAADKEAVSTNDPLLKAMLSELKRSKENLRLPEQPAPYFISYWIQETSTASISGKNGAIIIMQPEFHPFRIADVQIRVGSHEMDNTNLPLSDRFSSDDYDEMFDESRLGASFVPIKGDEASLRSALWLKSDQAYKKAISDYQKKKILQTTTVDEEKINDFSIENPNVFIGPVKEASFETEKWEKIIRKITGYLAAKPDIIEPAMNIEAEKIINYYVNTDGAVIRTSEVFYSLSIYARARTSDGMKVSNFRLFFVRDPKELPDEKELLSTAEIFSKELSELSKAEELKPYTGPAILGPDVAGVFFHEALGHRLEGERQRMPESGQTFKGKVGEKIIPDFLTVTDDPTKERFNNTTLAGFYMYDDEGIPALKVMLVEKGILKNYLMSRTPIKGFDNSNGHGRNANPMYGTGAVGRMANMIIDSENKVSLQKLKSMLIEEAKKQGKPYGLIIKHAEAGETNTSASQGFGGSFQAFRATPMFVYKVDAETGEEKLVRGIELVGTPLVSLEKIIATGDDAGVFNGTCGAESGMLPVSIVSPSILTSQIEVQRTGGKSKKPPILPSPFTE